ncbi:MAG TPA: tetratricopeptide repeat protein [Candidatus Gastranaerophilales bacterium]|nr:tetratricopeptide repeat protein [Candidatus Gastranaerophilales bacterium]
MYIYIFIILSVLIFNFNITAIATPQQYNNFIQIAYKALNNGNYQTAIENYEKALKLYPNEVNLYNNLGIAYSRTNNLNKAEFYYKKAILLNASNSLAYLNLSNIYQSEQKYLEAAECLKSYVKLNPSDKNVYYNLCELYFKAGNNDLCLKYGEKHVQSSANKLGAYCLMADSRKKSGDFEKASEYYDKALKSINSEKDRQNTPYILQELRNCRFKSRISNITPAVKAPAVVYNLVKTSKPEKAVYNLKQINSGLKYSDTVYKLNEILDFLWADENGNILLNEVIKRNIPIIITFGGKEQTNAQTVISYKKTPFYYLGKVPMPIIAAIPISIIYSTFHPEYKKQINITINIGENIIQMYKEPDSSFENNMYSLMSVMHEASHAVSSAIEGNHKNSLEEELTVSMMGYNFASNVLTGRILSHDESHEYAKQTLNSLMNDEHKTLPLYGNFKNTISSIGINLYNYDTYSDLSGLMQPPVYQ